MVDIAPDRLLCRLQLSGSTTEGAEIELAMLVLYVMSDDRYSRIETFPVDMIDGARARFDELGRIDADDRTEHTNSCSETFSRVLVLFEQRKWDELAELYAPTFFVESRRAGLRHTANGREGSLEGWKAAAEVGATRASGTVLGVRGDRLTLVRVAFGDEDEGPSAFTAEVLFVNELDVSGQIASAVLFDPGDRDAAWTELDERFASGDGSAYADIIRRNTGAMVAINARDWAGYAASAAHDFVMVDHRPASLGELQIEDLIDAHLALFDLVPDLRVELMAYHALDPEIAVSEIAALGHTVDGDPLDLSFINVVALRGSRIARTEFFPIDRLPEALARFEELGRGEGTTRRQLENAASRAGKRYGEAFLARDWQALTELMPEGSVWDDRRAGLKSVVRGRDARLENASAMADIGVEKIAYDVIAVRGERLALFQITLGGTASDFEAVELLVNEVDDEGRHVASVVFDPEDLDGAYDELDRRFIEGEGATYADIIRAGTVQRDALRAGDWETYRRLVAEDVVLVDHRPASLGEVYGLENVVEVLRALSPLIRDMTPRVVAYHRLAFDRSLLEMVATGTDVHGGTVEMVHLRLQQWRDGRVVRMELFTLEELEDAEARFDELGPQAPETLELDNAACRMGAVSTAAIQVEDWATVRGLLRDDLISDDRRTAIGSRAVGADAYIRNFRTLSDLGLRLARNEVVAIRGDNLALGRSEVTDEEGNEIATLALLELAPDGLAQRITWWDPDDLDAALAELDECFLASQPQHAHVWQIVLESLEAHRARDWSRFTDFADEDVVLVDHRPASLGRVEGRDAYREPLRGLVELIPDLRVYAMSVDALSANEVLYRVKSTGTNPEGGTIEQDFYIVGRFAGGRVARVEFFPLEDRVAAMGRFDELAGADPSRLSNAAVDAVDRENRLTETRDWGALSAALSETVIIRDERPGVGFEYVGREAVVEAAQALDSVGALTHQRDVVAVRGARLALMRLLVGPRDRPGFESEVYVLNEIDDAGRSNDRLIFDPGQLDIAVEELDRRYLVGEGANHAQVLRPIFEIFRTYNARDFAGARRVFASDAVLTDHRPVSLGVLTPDKWVDSWLVQMDLTPDMQFVPAWVRVVGRGAVVWEARAKGSTPDGALVELAFVNVGQVLDGLIRRYEWYPLEHLDEAFARARELAVAPDEI